MEEQDAETGTPEEPPNKTTHPKRRRRIVFAVCGVAIVLIAITLAAVLTTDDPDAGHAPNPIYQDTLTEMGINSSSSDTEIQKAMEVLADQFLASCPAGISVAVTRNDTRIIVPRGVFSVNDPDQQVTQDTLFEIGSVSKPLTGLVLAHEIVAGGNNLTLDTPLNQLLPDSVPDLIVNNELVTFRQLVTHTAGFPRLSKNVRERPMENGYFGPNPYGGYNETDMLDEISIASQELSQSGVHSYSNFGFSILGYLLGKSANSSFPQLQKELTDRLGMNDTWIELPQDDRQNLSTGHREGQVAPYWFDGGLFIDGAGSTLSTTRDLLTLIELLMSPEEKLQDEDLIEALQLSLESLYPLSDGVDGASFAWSYGGTPRLWAHTGGTAGFVSYVVFQPETRTGVVVMSNCAGDTTESRDLGAALASKLLRLEPIE